MKTKFEEQHEVGKMCTAFSRSRGGAAMNLSATRKDHNGHDPLWRAVWWLALVTVLGSVLSLGCLVPSFRCNGDACAEIAETSAPPDPPFGSLTCDLQPIKNSPKGICVPHVDAG